MNKAILKIKNIRCNSDLTIIRKILLRIEDLFHLKLKTETNSVLFNFGNETTHTKVINLLRRMVYPFIIIKNSLTGKI